MKAYQLLITIQDIEPPVWRKVVMPADATFNRLHDVIQTVTNFKSGYPYDAYHLFEFNLEEDNIRVTNDEEAYQEHLYFKKNRQKVLERLNEIPPEYRKFEEARIKNLSATIRKPTGLKIDQFLEKHQTLTYIYDFGDNWEFTIKLEKVLDDYPFGYPTLIDGLGDAPPEDVGGIPGFIEFLEIFHNKKHPLHSEMVAWAKEQNFKKYNPEFINSMLKFIKYKKNE